MRPELVQRPQDTQEPASSRRWVVVMGDPALSTSCLSYLLTPALSALWREQTPDTVNQKTPVHPRSLLSFHWPVISHMALHYSTRQGWSHCGLRNTGILLVFKKAKAYFSEWRVLEAGSVSIGLGARCSGKVRGKVLLPPPVWGGCQNSWLWTYCPSFLSSCPLGILPSRVDASHGPGTRPGQPLPASLVIGGGM